MKCQGWQLSPASNSLLSRRWIRLHLYLWYFGFIYKRKSSWVVHLKMCRSVHCSCKSQYFILDRRTCRRTSKPTSVTEPTFFFQVQRAEPAAACHRTNPGVASQSQRDHRESGWGWSRDAGDAWAHTTSDAAAETQPGKAFPFYFINLA